jgi:hypothetical protein
MTTRDTPEAALAAALRAIVETPGFGERFGGALIVDQESVGELAAAILGDRGVFWPTGKDEYRELIRQREAAAVAAEHVRIAEAVRGLELPSNWSRFKGGALWDEALAAFVAIVNPD